MKMVDSINVEITRHDLYADVVLSGPDVCELRTTMDKDIQRSDERIRKLKCRLLHLPTK